MFWRQALGYSLVVAVVIGVLWFQIGTIVPGFSAQELAARVSADSIHKLIDNPLFLPHKIVQYIFILLGQTGPFWMRTASAIFGVLIVVVFFDIARKWYSRRVAYMGSFLLLTSPWFLHFARLGTPEIMFACSIGLLWAGIRLRAHDAPRIRTVLVSLVIIGGCLYVPGLPWLIVPLVIWQRKLVWREFSKVPRWVAALVVALAIIGLAPLLYGFVRQPILIADWLLLPRDLAIKTWFSNLWHLPIWVAIRGPKDPVYFLGRTPLVNALVLTMFVLGAYVLWHYRRLDRVRAIVVILVLAAILAVFNGPIVLAIALPAIFLVATSGIALLLQQWFTVFPRNPLARTVGITMVILIIGLAGFYNFRSYFVAWPHAPETKQVFPSQQS